MVLLTSKNKNMRYCLNKKLFSLIYTMVYTNCIEIKLDTCFAELTSKSGVAKIMDSGT